MVDQTKGEKNMDEERELYQPNLLLGGRMMVIDSSF